MFGAVGMVMGTVRDASVDAYMRMSKAKRMFDGAAKFMDDHIFDDGGKRLGPIAYWEEAS